MHDRPNIIGPDVHAVLTASRISLEVMGLAALNIAQEFLELKRQTEETGQESETRLESLIQILEKEVENIIP